jgi:hydrogenase expression/formation protein HypE
MTVSCPVPASRYEQIVLGHGSGGRLSADLLARVILPGLGLDTGSPLEDQAILGHPALAMASGGRLAMTTDAFVVRPLFFPGGDIGRLAVHGTVNDLAVGGAVPLCLSVALILEEGLPIPDLERIMRSMKDACAEAHVRLVTGDTKVVDRGKGDKVFITTTGIGIVPAGRTLSITAARPGDRVIVSGTLGDHGVTILSVREGLQFDTVLESDSAPLASLTEHMLASCPEIRCMRDPTRGGLSSALNELAAASKVSVELWEDKLPLRPEVRGACEILGLDPLYVASEGRLMAIVPDELTDRLLGAMREHPLGAGAQIVGRVVASGKRDVVTLRTVVGSERIVPMLAGEQLPRIC